ncbi:MAG: PKD domain-containing protein [Chitinophagales bacterium]|nr:PKD domain-containing protein [Chitinophagales bacterium]MDW8392892.1 PKD domain-containing protein [Chitinophagales bacterium]
MNNGWISRSLRCTLKNVVVIYAACCLLHGSAQAQAPQILWSRNFGGSLADRAYDAAAPSSGGYVICGSTYSVDGDVGTNYGGSDAWVVRTDNDGNLLWQKNYGGSGDDVFKAVHLLPNGDMIFCGGTSSSDGDVASNKGGSDFWIVRTDASGAILWSYTFGGSGDEIANDMASSGDTAFIAVGYTFSSDGDVSEYKDAGDGWLLYFDLNGMMVTQKTKGGSNYDEFTSINSTANGGYIMCGLSYSNNGTVSGNKGGSDAWIARLSKQGNELWNFLYGTAADDAGLYVAELPDGHFALAGFSTINTTTDYWYLETDDQGTEWFSNLWGGTATDFAAGCLPSDAGAILLSGNSASPVDASKNCSFGLNDLWLLKTSGTSVLWQQCLGGSGDDFLSRSFVHGNQLLVHVGYSNSTDHDISDPKGDYDFWLVKTADGCDVQAGFSAQPTGGGLVSFENSSTSAYAYWWDFGDGNTSQDFQPVHAYSAAGTFTVCLVAISACTADTLCQQITVVCDSAQAGFTFSSTNLKALFSATGSNVAAWSWNFGDGNTASGANVIHNYAVPGTYTVCVTASNFCSSDTYCAPVTVDCPAVDAGFTWSANNLTVSFTSTSTNATKWKWKFGNGQNSSQENPTVTYASPGTYEVCLVAGNDCYSDTICQNITVSCPVPAPAFTYSANGLTVSFLNNTGNATSWLWEFGDGSTSSAQHPQHTYAAAGNYEVCLTATNSCGQATFCTTVIVACALPVAAFNAQVDFLQVSFENLSSGADSYLWDFGDGTTSTDVHPQHTYLNAGTYTVCLAATNSCGTASQCTDITVECLQALADFIFTADGLEVQFNNNSTNATSYVWSFGDGASSNDVSPVHSYSAPGEYEVCLTASNNCSQSSFCQFVTVTCPSFSVLFSYNINELTVQFQDQSAGSISWLWSFGDGSFSTLQNPSHTYAVPGTYEICLTASDGCSQQEYCEFITIVGTGLTAADGAARLYPNPFRGQATLWLPAGSEPVTLVLRNASGMTVYAEVWTPDAAGFTLHGHHLAAGWYWLELRSSSMQQTIPLVIY